MAHAQAVICPITPNPGATGKLCANLSFVTKSLHPIQYAISGLPACNSTTDGAFAEITNGVASPTYNATVSTTGTTHDLIFCNGSVWTYH